MEIVKFLVEEVKVDVN